MNEMTKKNWQAPLLFLLNVKNTEGYSEASLEDTGAETGSQY